MDLSLVKTGLATLLQKNTMAAMDGIFSQVREEGRGKGRGGEGREGGEMGGCMGRRREGLYVLMPT